MRFAEVALDTSLLAPPTSRRFFMAAWELQGLRVPVLPRVRRELHGVLGDSEQEHWIRVLDGQRSRGVNHSPATTNRILDAVEEAARQWVRDTLDVQQAQPHAAPASCALQVVQLDDAELLRARRIGAAIPNLCFRGPSRNNHFGDRQIIGQAAVKGYRVLALNNRNSIRRAATNHWLRDELGVNEDLLWESDEAVYELHSDGTPSPDADLLKAVLYACLPEHPRPAERVDEIVLQFLGRLGPAGMADCVEGMSRVWATEEGQQLATDMRAALPGSNARQTEASRVDAVRGAAARVGWQRSRSSP